MQVTTFGKYLFESMAGNAGYFSFDEPVVHMDALI